MANEISVSFSLRYAKDSTAASLAASYRADQAGSVYHAAVQFIGTSEENLFKGDVGTIGLIAVRNMDATNFVTLASLTATPSVKLLAGQSCLLPWTGTQVIAKADTAQCSVEYLIIEL